jgi:repressor of nif and glnA expression
MPNTREPEETKKMADRAPADALREQYRRLSDEELVNRVATGKAEYTEIAFALLQEEVSRRRLETKIPPP